MTSISGLGIPDDRRVGWYFTWCNQQTCSLQGGATSWSECLEISRAIRTSAVPHGAGDDSEAEQCTISVVERTTAQGLRGDGAENDPSCVWTDQTCFFAFANVIYRFAHIVTLPTRTCNILWSVIDDPDLYRAWIMTFATTSHSLKCSSASLPWWVIILSGFAVWVRDENAVFIAGLWNSTQLDSRATKQLGVGNLLFSSLTWILLWFSGSAGKWRVFQFAWLTYFDLSFLVDLQSVRGHNLMRWVVTFVIGVLTGLVCPVNMNYAGRMTHMVHIPEWFTNVIYHTRLIHLHTMVKIRTTDMTCSHNVLWLGGYITKVICVWFPLLNPWNLFLGYTGSLLMLLQIVMDGQSSSAFKVHNVMSNIIPGESGVRILASPMSIFWS